MEVQRMHQSSKRTFRDKIRLGFSKRKTQSLDEGYSFHTEESQAMRDEQRYKENLNEKTVSEQRRCHRVKNRTEGFSLYDKINRQISAEKSDSKSVPMKESQNAEKYDRRDRRKLVEDITEQIEEDLFKITMERAEDTYKNTQKEASHLQNYRTPARYLCEIRIVPVMFPKGEDISLRARFLKRRPAVAELDEDDRQRFLQRLSLYLREKELDSLHMI